MKRDGPAEETKKIPARDFVIIPLLVVATIIVMAASAEIAARMTWPVQLDDACEVWAGKVNFFKPNCTSTFKLAEAPLVHYKYNDCGYRSEVACAAKPENGIRVVVLGTSIAHGYGVSYEESFAGRVEASLTQQCQRPVDIQSIGVDEALGPTWHTLSLRVAEGLAVKPDVFLVTVSPFDLLQYNEASEAAPAPLPPPTSARRLVRPNARIGSIAWLKNHMFLQSFAFFGAQHFAYSDTSRYTSLFLHHDDQADYLRSPLSERWLMRLAVARGTLGEISAAARQAHVPLVVVYVPSRAQALLSAAPSSGLTPFALDEAIGRIVRGNGDKFQDITTLTRGHSDLSEDFYAVDTHPNGKGHAIIAAGVESALVQSVPVFASCSHAST